MKRLSLITMALLCFVISSNLMAQTTKLTLDLTKPGVNVSPTLYGMMTEEINYSYDGGLYGELIRNRIFQDNPPPPARNRRAMATQPAVTEFPASPAPDQPVHWSLLAAGDAQGSYILDRAAGIPN